MSARKANRALALRYANALGENFKNDTLRRCVLPPNDYKPTCVSCTRAEKNEFNDSSVNSTDKEDQ
jgi:hypothetical protein